MEADVEHKLKREKLFLLILTSFCFMFMASPIYGQKSIGVVESNGDKNVKNTEDILVENWTGKKFIFLEKPKSEQEYGYQLTNSGPVLDYDKFAEKVITVKKVESDGSVKHKVVFELNDSEEITAKAPYPSESFNNIAFFPDRKKAKKRWLGKYIYIKKPKYIFTYDAEKDKKGSIKIKNLEPLKVIDVWWGFSRFSPLWLIVEKSTGEKGYLPIAYSWTNQHVEQWKFQYLFLRD
ncbi:MAG: hypothetical protein K9L76_02720, partial [Candidatus Omnitrophica bacterium]|nr:hypothetical protein [Candidatus Omnitrophota bacterium]